MKYIYTLVFFMCVICSVNAAPRMPHVRHIPYHHHYHPNHHYHPSYSGMFLTSFAGSVLGNIVVNAVRPAPAVVVQQPVIQQPVVIQNVSYQPKQIWVDGHYEDQVMTNGSIIKVWVPGHWVIQ